MIEDATKKGGEVLVGGNRPVEELNYFEPTLITRASQDMECVKNEIFGPLCPLISFDSTDSAIEMANNTSAGLAAYVLSGI